MPIGTRSHRLYSYVGPSAVWVIICEVAVIIFVFVFIGREYGAMRKVKVNLKKNQPSSKRCMY